MTWDPCDFEQSALSPGSDDTDASQPCCVVWPLVICISATVLPVPGRQWGCGCPLTFLFRRAEARNPRVAPDRTAHQPCQQRRDSGARPASGEGARAAAAAGPPAAHLPQVPTGRPPLSPLVPTWAIPSGHTSVLQSTPCHHELRATVFSPKISPS